jgi:ADP-ribose pyrophosphatase YjhB (NUDIX family)
MKKTIGTVLFIVSDGKVLLAEIEYPNGQRLWNGIGGVVDDGESPADAVVREVSEETQLIISTSDIEEAMPIHLPNLELHVFTAKKFGGQLDIIDPTLKQLRWFDLASVPYGQMHAGNDEWLPGVLLAA